MTHPYKIIFCDTNIIFGLFQRIIKNLPLKKSTLFQLAEKHHVYINAFILRELEIVFLRDYALTLLPEHIITFFQLSNFKIITSQETIDAIFLDYVYDNKDLPILQDAYSIKAHYLITKNLKDFDVLGIKEQFHIQVTYAIPVELFD